MNSTYKLTLNLWTEEKRGSACTREKQGGQLPRGQRIQVQHVVSLQIFLFAQMIYFEVNKIYTYEFK